MTEAEFPNTDLAPAPAPVDPPIPPAAQVEVAPGPSPDTAVVQLDGKDWTKVLIVASGRIPAETNGRPVIIVEDRKVNFRKEDGVEVADSVELKTSGYPAKGDLYYRTDEAVEFPKDVPTVTLGKDVQQGMFGGLSPHPGFVNVGPASPIYGAVNLAYHRGAKEVEIVGMSDYWKERLVAPWFDIMDKHPEAPASIKITVS